jgi:hypothetical protein
MIFLHQVAAAILLVTLTLCLQSAGVAALLALVRQATEGHIHKLWPFRVARCWLRSESNAFARQRPIELLKDGKARDIIVEFRRLQAGEPS